MNHKEVKRLLSEHVKPLWTDIYKMLKTNFSISKEEVKKFITHENLQVRNAAKWHLNILDNYQVRQEYDGVVSIKLVIPSYCQAKCEFCFMNGYKDMNHDYNTFIYNFLNSLTEIIIANDGKQLISLDITGNEPTFSPVLLKEICDKLRNYKYLDKITRCVLTTNGFMLKNVINDLKGVVNYVNISTHHYNLDERKNIFGTWKIPTDDELVELITKLCDIGIITSTVSVIYKEMENFSEFIDNYINWAKKIGFSSIRFRGDCATDKFAPTFNKYISEILTNRKYLIIENNTTNDSHWCRIIDKTNGYLFYMLQGVADTYKVSRGIEYIINDDGKAYLDYYKQHPFCENDLPMDYIFDKRLNVI